MISRHPSPAIVTAYAGLWIGIYWLFYFLLRDWIPEKYLRDALEIVNLMATSTDDASLSYATPAKIFQLFSYPTLQFMVGMINAAVIFVIVQQVKTWRGMAVLLVVLPPMILLGFMSPTKEVFVVIMAGLLLWSATHLNRPLWTLGAVGLSYVAYGLLFRQYYLLILFFFVCLSFFPRHRLLQIALCLGGLIVLFLLPADVFLALQEPRDVINMNNERWGPDEVRTAFYNPFDPSHAVGFLLNYGYAALRLNFAIFWDLTPNELVLFLNVVIYAALVRYGVMRLQGPAKMLTKLFLAHILVLIFFEPDLGSYFRHFSSVFLYLVPVLAQSEKDHRKATESN